MTEKKEFLKIKFVEKIIVVSLVGLALVLAQPLVIPYFGQILLDWGL